MLWVLALAPVAVFLGTWIYLGWAYDHSTLHYLDDAPEHPFREQP